MANGDASFSVVISIEQLKRLDRAKNSAGESSRSSFVRSALESHIAGIKAKPTFLEQARIKELELMLKKSQLLYLPVTT